MYNSHCKPTPGPWTMERRVNGTVCDYVAITGPRMQHLGNFHFGNVSEREAEANARLAVTAPQLVKCLRDVLAKLPEEETDLYNRGRMVLADATGQEC